MPGAPHQCCCEFNAPGGLWTPGRCAEVIQLELSGGTLCNPTTCAASANTLLADGVALEGTWELSLRQTQSGLCRYSPKPGGIFSSRPVPPFTATRRIFNVGECPDGVIQREEFADLGIDIVIHESSGVIQHIDIRNSVNKGIPLVQKRWEVWIYQYVRGQDEFPNRLVGERLPNYFSSGCDATDFYNEFSYSLVYGSDAVVTVIVP